VLRACHAVSLDDERTTFHPVLWDEHGEKPAAPDPNTGKRHTRSERLSQVWFTGVHSNVGGGYPDDALAHIPLCWIMTEAEHCGLKFKPGCLDRLKWARDKDGRLYDSRTGLGGYYRYGPRKIADFCDMVLSRRPQDKVKIDRPKIHESAFDRIHVGARHYAPIGWPAKYEIVKDDGEIIPPYETADQARSRCEVQETVWNLVWKRRVVYFATVAASLYLAIYPLARALPRAFEYETPLRVVSDAIRLAGTLLPGLAAPWLNGYARDPVSFVIGAAVVALLILWGNPDREPDHR